MPGVAVLPQGLEVAGYELERLGAGSVQPLRRAAAFEADMACLYRLHLQARLPFRLREMGRFPCSGRDELRRHSALPRLGTLAAPIRTFRVDATGIARG